MGHHYLPQRLLKNFATNNLVWMFDKTGVQEPKLLPVKEVAQEPGMYPQHIEDRLNNEIEQPFNAILERLAIGGGVLADDRPTISTYVITMYRRVPNGRTRSKAAFPHVAEAVKRQTLARIDLLEQMVPSESELAKSGRQNIGRIFDKLEATDGEWLWHDTLMPERFQNIIGLLNNMAWCIAIPPPGRVFVLGDAPVLFDEQVGMADSRATLTMPISPSKMLVARHGRHSDNEFMKLPMQRLRGVNAESVERAKRWVFALSAEEWLRKIGKH